MDIKELLFELSAAVAAGTVHSASDIACKYLSEYTECEQNGLTVIGRLGGNSTRTLMLDAHIDEIAFTVTNIDDEGFLTVAKCGGFDLRSLPARAVTVHGKREIPAVFCSTPPHLSSDKTEFDDIAALKIDTMLGAEAKELIALGDMVTFRQEPVCLAGHRVTGKSFDDRAGVACLIELARRLSGKDLPMNIAFVFSDQEELGYRGSRTATFDIDPDEAIAIDVSFGDGPGISPDECGKLSGGAMIGVSPVLDSAVSRKLIDIAKENDISYQTEVMGGRTGTNGDAISITRGGVKTGLVSIPLRNMHTDIEVIDLDDIISVCDILEKYILSGGVGNA